jgi:hypothetical protein
MAIDWFSTAFDPTNLPGNLQAAYSYWLSRTQGNELPPLERFNPLELPLELLPNTVIFDMGTAAGHENGRYLMIGTNMVKIFKARIGPGKLTELIAENRRPLLEDLSEQLIEERRPIHVRFGDKNDEGIEFSVDSILLPMALPPDGPNVVVAVNHIVVDPSDGLSNTAPRSG